MIVFLLPKEAKKNAIKLSEQYDKNLPVTLSHNNYTNNFLAEGGQGRQDFGMHPKCLGPQFDQTCGCEDPE